MTLRALSLVLALVIPTLSWAQGRTPLTHSVDIQVPVPPVPARIAGRWHLAFELHITNFRHTAVALTRVAVLDGDRATRLSELRDAALVRALGHPGGRSDPDDARIIGPGRRVVVHQWIALDEAATLPRALAHDVEVALVGPTGRERVVVRGGALDVPRQRPIVLDAPLRGGPWVAVYDPTMTGGHRMSTYAIDGRARIPGRFAIDWIKVDDDGAIARGDRADVTDWHGYGAEVLAVADGLVTDARDDIARDSPVSGTPAPPIALENASGNYVTLRLGEGRYAFYEHLQPGSIRVRAGDRVQRGQMLGLLGNSGSSSAGPHLHFHVSDADATLAAEGLPFVFRSFQVLGAFGSIDAVFGGARWTPAPRHAGGTRTMEMPAANVVVRFASDVDPT